MIYDKKRVFRWNGGVSWLCEDQDVFGLHFHMGPRHGQNVLMVGQLGVQVRWEIFDVEHVVSFLRKSNPFHVQASQSGKIFFPEVKKFADVLHGGQRGGQAKGKPD